MENNIIQLTEAIEFVNDSIKANRIQIALVSDAPKWLKLLFGDNYFAYKNTVYTPVDHLILLAPDSNPIANQLLINKDNRESLRTIATANLFPWMLAIKDNRTNSLLDLLRFRFGYRLNTHYFIYKYVFLKASDNPYLTTILGGFISTRRCWFHRVDPDKVVSYIESTLHTSAKSLTENPTK